MTAARGRLCSVARATTIPWDKVTPAPLVLVTGPEGLLAERAVDRVVQQARAEDPEVEVTRLEAAGYEPGRLGVATSASLFGEPRVVVLGGLEAGTDAAFADLKAYAGAPEPDVVLVAVHGGGNRGRPTLDAVRAAGATEVACDPVKRDSDKTDFAVAELRRGGRRAEPAAVRALVEACGADLRELAAACQQLLADTTGVIGADVVTRYYGGRVEATGFRVADAAVAGRAGEAVALLRHAVATGTDPVPLVAALAVRLRVLAKVAAARGRGLTAGDLGMAPWQMDRARRELTAWRPETLAAAITAVAQADAEVKGAGRDPVFAVERAVLRIAAAAGN
ncbi:DNA polymerase III subunit delta [Isoptericola sp. b441]|uniref:DNA-directed DNA polymerase n=1 Tax=Actinotalea lenta TaxID=3064654 RepID=A0ABT9DC05_9CELL|nr:MULTISPECIES: DNA polymerase III subunit delta [unclassified Isoptericola]MDO8108130.1 DNA polymerase III subunit delta [Isoptericola sp. b441]MDO8120200.1 DNA polymerase III subunit delta [Isoptericola sp. b490]